MSLTALVVGCGSIGARHIRNLRALGVAKISAFDPDPRRIALVSTEYNVTPVESLAMGLATSPTAVLVCTPPALHLAVARDAVRAGAHVFVEKPISHTTDGVEALVREAEHQRRVLTVGYHLRCDPAVAALHEVIERGDVGRPLSIRAAFGQHLGDWRPGTDYRLGYNASAAAGGGVLLDLSHEIDYVRWMLGEVTSVYCAAEHLSDLEVDVEDVAALVLRLASGSLAEIHLDTVRAGYERGCTVIGTQATASWDSKLGVTLWGREGAVRVVHAGGTDPNAAYLEEMRRFLASITHGSPSSVDGHSALRTLEVVHAARLSARTRAEVSLPSLAVPP